MCSEHHAMALRTLTQIPTVPQAAWRSKHTRIVLGEMRMIGMDHRDIGGAVELLGVGQW